MTRALRTSVTHLKKGDRENGGNEGEEETNKSE